MTRSRGARSSRARLVAGLALFLLAIFLLIGLLTFDGGGSSFHSGPLAARYVAKNVVAAGLADCCQLQVAYAIGVPQPVSVMVQTFGTGKVSDAGLTELIRKNFDLTPRGIIEQLKLRRPVYRQTAAYGHFGREEDSFTWERTDLVDALRKGA